MKYYKIIQEQKFIGVITSENFKRYNPISHLMLSSSENYGEYVRLGDKLYRDYWMVPVEERDFTYEIASIIEITEKEYNDLHVIIIEHKEIPPEYIEEDHGSDIYVQMEEDTSTTIEDMKALKISALSAKCRQTIENGFDLEIQGTIQHFSLDTQDQLNLLTLSVLADTQELIPYHADNELCTFYTSTEIKTIVSAANRHKIYHTTYYNALKNYVNNLNTVEEIAAVQYGMVLPEDYQTEVLKSLNN